MVFAAAGTWGDVQPHVALAKHFGGKLLCDEKWVDSARRFEIDVEPLCKPINHQQSLSGFVSSIDYPAVFRSLYEASDGAQAIVTSFFLWPAKIVAEIRGIPWIATTDSPLYFNRHVGIDVDVMHAVADIMNGIREVVGIDRVSDALHTEKLIGLSPAWLGRSIFNPLGFLTPHNLAVEQPQLPKEAFCYVSLGSASYGISNELLIACKLLGLHCVCTGDGVSDEHVTYIPFDVGVDASRIFESAKMAIIHGGTATACQALKAGTPIIVKPTGLDQFFNAEWLSIHGATLWPSIKAKAVKLEIESREEILTGVEKLFSEWL